MFGDTSAHELELKLKLPAYLLYLPHSFRLIWFSEYTSICDLTAPGDSDVARYGKLIN